MKQRHKLWGTCALVLALSGCDRDDPRTESRPPHAPPQAPPVVTLSGAEQSAARDSGATTETEIERGKYLVTIGGCNDCHTPKKMGPKGPEPDGARLLAGHPESERLPPPPRPAGAWEIAVNGTLTAWSGPWGRAFAANLTPDKDTGLGGWTEDQFTRAMKTGKHLGGPEGSREILPPMPWRNYAVMTNADFKAVFAYLRSIPAVHNSVPSPLPPAAPPGKKAADM